MEQPWNQRDGISGYALGESCHADLDQAMTGLGEVDGALLMELMEDLPSSDLLLDDADVDRQLSHVIRSLELEIGGDGGDDEAAVKMAESLDRIEDVFSDDMDCYDDYQGASSFGYWPQVSSSSLVGHDEAEGWCVYTINNGYEGGSFLGYDDTTVDHHQYYYCCAEGSADHMYLPLWE